LGVLAAGALLWAGCEGGGSSGDGSSSGASGSASGSWSVSAEGYHRLMELTQDGDRVTGTVIDGKGKTQPVSGSIQGSTVVLDSRNTHGTGTISGDSMSGQYACPTSRGSWRATRN
jgi:hypothetical protein